MPIVDWDKFRDFVKEHGDKTQSEMAELWDGEISQRTMSRALQKIGHSQRDEAKRSDFSAQLKDPKAPHLIYVAVLKQAAS